jgi:hypothetical protein
LTPLVILGILDGDIVLNTRWKGEARQGGVHKAQKYKEKTRPWTYGHASNLTHTELTYAADLDLNQFTGKTIGKYIFTNSG